MAARLLVLVLAFVGSDSAGDTARLPNLVVGTQAIYSAHWRAYNFTAAPNVLAEQRQVVVDMGGSQLKLKLSGVRPDTTCASYRIRDRECDQAQSLAALAKVPAVAATLALPSVRFYHIWMYTYASGANWLQRDWTAASLAAEKAEVKELAAHLLSTYEGTGKVFMCGNWEGDWMLMGASGCRNPDGKGYNKSCDPTPEVTQRMVLWGQARQSAFDEAREEYEASRESRRLAAISSACGSDQAEGVFACAQCRGQTVAAVAAAGWSSEEFAAWCVGVAPSVVSVGDTRARIAYYIEFNLGPQAVSGRPGVINSVLGAVNPDLVSYSSYSTTNAYQTTTDVAIADRALHGVLELAATKLANKGGIAGDNIRALGFVRRVFIGEFGSHQPDQGDQVRFVKNVTRAAVSWGVPFVLYWELYDNDSTQPIIPRSGETTQLKTWMSTIWAGASDYVQSWRREHSGAAPSAAQLGAWIAWQCSNETDILI
eukprot:TRINITY_DN69249_c0_g1_i1.p1 TRINITY_DN69249_c0_g1~~TRINITY_DN69249_c0_g1_i1.p1  ORF type:complete len:503 (-),score=77.58 TRINITY_DN69249_c0_g1_i1:130-1581(-)